MALGRISLLLTAVAVHAAEFQLQRAGNQVAAQRWSAWSSIPGAGSFLALPTAVVTMPAQSQATSQMLDLGKGLGLFECQKGDGRTFPKAGDKLKMHYIGKLSQDDTQFDSSRDRGTPFTFTIGVGDVIKGWDEGVMKMSLGERGILQVPAAKAYGARGAGHGKIPADADLYFDVELLAINSQEKPEKLPEQGYEGKKVRHENMETCTGDWRREYGPKAGKDGPCKEEKPEAKPEKEAPTHTGGPKKSGAAGSVAFSGAALAVALYALF